MQGCIITHVDDFTIAGKKEFNDRVLRLVEIKLTVSKIERDNFCYTGLDISTLNDRIEIEMKQQQIDRFLDSVNSYLAIKTLVSIGTGGLVTLMLWAFDIDYFILWGVLARGRGSWKGLPDQKRLPVSAPTHAGDTLPR